MVFKFPELPLRLFPENWVEPGHVRRKYFCAEYFNYAMSIFTAFFAIPQGLNRFGILLRESCVNRMFKNYMFHNEQIRIPCSMHFSITFMTSLISPKMANNDKQLQVRIAPGSRCKSCTPRLAIEPQNVKASACMKVLSIFGHKSLDEKLLHHDIRRKRSKSARFVRNLMSKSLSVVKTPGFGQDDLEKLSKEQLEALKKSFVKKLAEKRREHAEFLEMKAEETEKMVRFMEEIQNIELAAKTALKPCVNVLPDSDDMARVLLLN
jgi:hypothetical protein